MTSCPIVGSSCAVAEATSAANAATKYFILRTSGREKEEGVACWGPGGGD